MTHHRTPIIVAALSLTLALSVTFAAAPTRYSISVPTFELQKNERVRNFEFTVTHGHITALRHVPWPWRIKINNTDGDKATIDAVAESGTTAVNAAFFQDFVEVSLGDDATLRLKVETSFDWEKLARKLDFGDKEMVRKAIGE